MPRALYLLALAVFAMGTSEFMLAGLVPDIAARLDVPVGTAGLLTSAFAVGMVLGAPVMAASARRLPVRATLLGCVALFALAHVVGAVTPSFAALVAVRVVAAFANAGFLAVALSTAATLVPADRTGRAVAVLLSGTTAAMVAGVPAGRSSAPRGAGSRPSGPSRSSACPPRSGSPAASPRAGPSARPCRPSTHRRCGRSWHSSSRPRSA